jgi:hypothetical protein
MLRLYYIRSDPTILPSAMAIAAATGRQRSPGFKLTIVTDSIKEFAISRAGARLPVFGIPAQARVHKSAPGSCQRPICELSTVCKIVGALNKCAPRAVRIPFGSRAGGRWKSLP